MRKLIWGLLMCACIWAQAGEMSADAGARDFLAKRPYSPVAGQAGPVKSAESNEDHARQQKQSGMNRQLNLNSLARRPYMANVSAGSQH